MYFVRSEAPSTLTLSPTKQPTGRTVRPGENAPSGECSERTAGLMDERTDGGGSDGRTDGRQSWQTGEGGATCFIECFARLKPKAYPN